MADHLQHIKHGYRIVVVDLSRVLRRIFQLFQGSFVILFRDGQKAEDVVIKLLFVDVLIVDMDIIAHQPSELFGVTHFAQIIEIGLHQRINLADVTLYQLGFVLLNKSVIVTKTNDLAFGQSKIAVDNIQILFRFYRLEQFLSLQQLGFGFLKFSHLDFGLTLVQQCQSMIEHLAK